MISYEDGIAALAWLSNAFGFRERVAERVVGPDGRLMHAEFQIGDGSVMLATPTPAYENPARHREHCAAARKWSETRVIIDGVLVHVDDVDQHYARAKEAGATILSELEDAEPGPGRRYRAEDLEGHRWMFVQRR
jgi:PhnB protein